MVLAIPAAPPVMRRPTSFDVHGRTINDDYAWIKARNWPDVLRDPSLLPDEIRALLEAENAYCGEMLAPLADLTKTLAAEMRGRIKEDDADVPVIDGPFAYYARHREGGQHELACRRPRDGGEEVVLLDGDALAQGKPFFDLAMTMHAPDHAKLAWSADEAGSEFHTIYVRDLATGRDGADAVPDTDGGVVWSADSASFFYVRLDANHRPSRVYRHDLGTDPAHDPLIFEEHDPAWFVGIARSRSGRFGLISVHDHDATEIHLLELAQKSAQPRLVAPRAPGVQYAVDHRGDVLFIRTNLDAEDFRVLEAPLGSPQSARELVPHRPGCMIISLAAFADFLVRLERVDGAPRLVVRALADGAEHTIAFDDEAYSLNIQPTLDFATPVLRFSFSSMTTPREVVDYDMDARTRTLRKRQTIPSGHDPAAYVTRRLFATAPDGERVPISILHRRGLAYDGAAPLLLYGYGAYGHATSASFSANRLSLVDRGFVYAIAHVRGGTDKGRRWYLDGKLAKKANTFTDFLAVARTLIEERITSAGRIVAHGGSAGGMLMGAVANMAPELFAGVIADVPFVDVLNTMLDADLPLTPPEWLEWGDPITDVAAFDAIRAYSPYDNIRAQAYPPILALGGLTDPRVTYWEPAKWVARLRDTMTSGGPILLKTNMDAGHGGAAGRFDRLGEVALDYAFALACVGAVQGAGFSR